MPAAMQTIPGSRVERKESSSVGCNRLARPKLATRRLRDRADRLDAQNARKSHPVRVSLAGEEFGAVQTKSFDPDEDLTGKCLWHRPLLNLQHLRATRLMHDHCLHHLGHFRSFDVLGC